MTYIIGTTIALTVMAALYLWNRHRTRFVDHGTPIAEAYSTRVIVQWYPEYSGDYDELAAYVDHCCKRLDIARVRLWPTWEPGQVAYGGRQYTHGRYYSGTNNVVIGLWDEKQDTEKLVRHELTHMLSGILDHGGRFKVALAITTLACEGA